MTTAPRAGASGTPAPRILLLGKDGQLGWELQRALAPLGDVVACGRRGGADGAVADLSDPDAVAALVRRLAPALVVNAAAYTAVDRAEAEPDAARTINATAPGAIAAACADTGATLVHYGTDYVFDGSGDAPRDEDAPTAPLGVYGRTKLDGERAIRAAGCRHLILRTSWVHAPHGGNFARTMLRLAAERDALTVIADQIGAPTGADLIADVTAHAARRVLADPALGGTYHCVAGGETSWYDYARLVVEYARGRGHPVRVAPDAIRPIATRDYPTPAARPLNSRLSTERLQRTFDLHLPHWRPGVERLLAEMLPTLQPART